MPGFPYDEVQCVCVRACVSACVCVCVCRWARLLLKLKGEARVLRGAPPQGSFQMPREGPGLSALR